MEIHHQKHHATYVKMLNEMEEKSLEALSKGNLRTALNLQASFRVVHFKERKFAVFILIDRHLYF